MKLPQFPEDFKVLYAEGASYWWWSPDTGPEWDGTMPMEEDWPVGLMVGCEDTASHEMVAGEDFKVIWDVDGDEGRIERTGQYDSHPPTPPEQFIQFIIEEVLTEAGVYSPS